MKQEKINNKITGDQFEAYIGTLYQNLGYRVSYNVNLSGQQIDILAEKFFPGAGQAKLAIECKFQTTGKIGNQKVQDFISSSDNLIRHDGITNAVMVSNTGYTDTAWAAAHKNQLITLLTQRELEDQLFNLSSTYKSFIDRYEREEIFKEYVELEGTYYGKDGQKKIDNIEEFLTKWASEPHDRFLTIFGDFGSGKTTMLSRIKYAFCKAYIQGTSILKPFMINLKDFHKYDTIDKLLVYSSVSQFEREISLTLIYQQIESGQILLLLDGFDEMAQQIDTDIRMQNFLNLAPLLGARAILTCRPSYFVSKSEYSSYAEQMMEISAFRESSNTGSYKRENLATRELIDQLTVYLNQEFLSPHMLKTKGLLEFETIEVSVLSPRSINDYLSQQDLAFKKILGFNWSYVKDFLFQIYDVSDLMSRPMLLKMIVKTLLSGKLSLNGKYSNIGPAILYDLYTSLYLDIDYKKGESRQLFTPEQRRSLSISIALMMFDERSMEVSYHKLLGFISDHEDLKGVLGEVGELTFEQIVADMQICTFLVASDNGNFKFAHKSFMEFFVARYLKYKMMEREIPTKLFQILPKEVLYFLGSYAAIDTGISQRMRNWINSAQPSADMSILRRNVASSLLYSGSVISELNWSDLEISYLEFKRRTIKKTCFDNVNIRNVEFNLANLYSNSWQNMHLEDVEFIKCELYGFDCSAIVRQVSFKEGKLIDSSIRLTGNNLHFEFMEIRASKLLLSGNAYLKRCRLRSTSMDWQNSFAGEISFHESTVDFGKVFLITASQPTGYRFLKCLFFDQHIEVNGTIQVTTIFDKCTFYCCKISGMILDKYNLKETNFVDCCGFAILESRMPEPKELEAYRKPGKLVYFKIGELFYIPEKTWEACQGNFQRFKKKIILQEKERINKPK